MDLIVYIFSNYELILIGLFTFYICAYGRYFPYIIKQNLIRHEFLILSILCIIITYKFGSWFDAKVVSLYVKSDLLQNLFQIVITVITWFFLMWIFSMPHKKKLIQSRKQFMDNYVESDEGKKFVEKYSADGHDTEDNLKRKWMNDEWQIKLIRKEEALKKWREEKFEFRFGTMIIVFILLCSIFYMATNTWKKKILPFGNIKFECNMEYEQMFLDEETKKIARGLNDDYGTPFPIINFPNRFELTIHHFETRIRNDINRFDIGGAGTNVPLNPYCEDTRYNYQNTKEGVYRMYVPACTKNGDKLFRRELSRNENGTFSEYKSEILIPMFFGKYQDTQEWSFKIFYENQNSIEYYNFGMPDADYACEQK